MNRYLLLVGGTGQHVALALADYLVLAHSIFSDPPAPIRFILLDADPSGGSTASAWTLAAEQLAVLRAIPDPQGGSFLETGHTEPIPAHLSDSTSSAKAAMEQLEGPIAAELFFSPAQQKINIRTGYHGEPRVAAALADALLNQMRQEQYQSEALSEVLAAMKGQNRVCVVGSAVGGTGAGVLPRLVEALATTENRVARLGAVVGLPWFQIQGKADQTSRQRANAVSCIYHYFHTLRKNGQPPYRLMLFGHPTIGTAKAEADYGAEKQGVKENLTLPIYAAAATHAFLTAPDNHPDLNLADHALCAHPDGIHLADTLDWGNGIQLQELIKRNQDWLQLYENTRAYLNAPYRPVIFALFSKEVRVPSFDTLSEKERDWWIAGIDRLAQAKRRAIARWKQSDSSMKVVEPEPWEGIHTLRTVPTGTRRFELPNRGAVQPLRADRKSKQWLLPEEVIKRAMLADGDPGTRARLDASARAALSPFLQLAGTRIPDVMGIEMVLMDILNDPSTHQWENLTRTPLTVETVKIKLPAVLSAQDGDGPESWLRRWFLVLVALARKQLRIESLSRPLRGRIQHVLRLEAAHGKTPAGALVGYLSPELACVPAPTSFWNEQEAVESLARSVGNCQEPLARWLVALSQVGQCRYHHVPRWIERLLGQLDAPLRMERPLNLDNSRAISLSWPTNEASQMLRVPLPAVSGAGNGIEELCNAFALPIEPLLTTGRGLSQGAQAARSVLTNAQQIVQVVPSGTGWVQSEERRFWWADSLNEEQMRHFHGRILLEPGANVALSLPGTAELLRADDVWCERLVLLVGQQNELRPILPIHPRYMGLVEGTPTVRSDGNERWIVEATLRGRREPVRHTYTGHKQVIRIPPGNLGLFLAPKKPTIGTGAYFLLIQNQGYQQILQVRMVWMAAQQPRMASDWYGPAARFHYVLPPTSSVQALSVAALQVRVLGDNALESLSTGNNDPIEGGAWTELGWISVDALPFAPEDRTEQWCIDFGTTSTVVARCTTGTTPTALVIWPSIDRDPTLVLSQGPEVLRTELAWLPTWNGGPASLRSETLPSQLVQPPNQRGPLSAAEDPYGVKYVLDTGEEIDPALKEGVLPRDRPLKWVETSQGHLRQWYLHHVLEQALLMEAARGEPLPATVTATFTLPLRQKDSIERFSNEVNAACHALKKTTVITFNPRYEWESLAVVPNALAVPGSTIFLTADLGGGTLDLYAAWYHDGTRVRQAVESAEVGARFCEAILGTKIREDVRRAIRKGWDMNERKRWAAEVPAVHQYFDRLFRYIVLWVDGLQKRWNISDKTPIRLMLAGLGWALPGSPETQAEVAERLTRTAQTLNLTGNYEAWQNDPKAGKIEGRKTWLARTCAQNTSGVMIDALENRAANMDQILGLPIRLAGKTCMAGDGLNIVQDPSTLFLDITEARKLEPTLDEPGLSAILGRLKRNTNPDDQNPGAYDPTHHRLSLSVLTCVAEYAIRTLTERTQGKMV